MNFLQKLAEQGEWNGGQGPVEQIAPAPQDMKQSSDKKTLMHMLYRTQAEEEEVTAQHNGLIKFFQDNPSPSEDEMNAFADQMGTDPDALDERIYALLSSLLKGVGKNNDRPDDEFDAEQLQKGIDTEMEHTEDELIAKMIAKDHLAEIPDYYNRLGQMEDEAGDEANAEMDMEMDDREYHDDDSGMEDDRRMGFEEEEFGDEDMDMDLDDDDDDEEVVDPAEVVALAKQLQKGEFGYEEFLKNLEDLTSVDDDEMDDELDDEMDDEDLDMGDDDYESGDLEDDEFEVDLGQMPERAEEEEACPRRRKKRVRRLTFKESLMKG